MIVGMVSTRFAGLDGVSLETAKLATVLRAAGHEVVWFAGELGAEFAPGTEHLPAHFTTDENRRFQEAAFGTETMDPAIRADIESRTADIEEALAAFVAEYGVDVLVPQNSSAIPMQLPLGLATARLLARTGLPAVAHHHDFGWERERFTPTAVPDILEQAFPPAIPNLAHVVINSLARSQLMQRRGLSSTVLPNVMPFENPPPPGNGEAFRGHLEIEDGAVLLVQPTRVIPRKGIEDALELAARLDGAVVAVTHPERDEGGRYARFLEDRAADLAVDLRFTAVDETGAPSLADAYAAADLVTYPSRIEGFGNALLEAVYYRRPLLVYRYPVYVADIAPTGLQAIEYEGELDAGTVAEVERWLGDAAVVAEATAANYEIGSRHFSFDTVRRVFLPLVERAARH